MQARRSWIESLKRPHLRVRKFRSRAAIDYCAEQFIQEYGSKAHEEAADMVLQYDYGTVERDFWGQLAGRIAELRDLLGKS